MKGTVKGTVKDAVKVAAARNANDRAKKRTTVPKRGL
jgi:hypothetical protein